MRWCEEPFNGKKCSRGTGKVYLARFTDTETKDVFYKFGHTTYSDALDRFKYEVEQYRRWDIKIMCTVWGVLEQVQQDEINFKTKFPKNFWLQEKISGVTEIVKLKYTQIQEVFGMMTRLKTIREPEVHQFLREQHDQNSTRSTPINL